MTPFEQFLQRKQREYGEKFNASGLAPQFVQYYNNHARIEVEPRWNPEKLRRGTIGVTTGWAPVFLLMHRRNARGSWDTLSATDQVVKVVAVRRDR